MLRDLLHKLVSHPAVYDAVQRAAGAKAIARWLAAHTGEQRGSRVVLDLGGGTGLHRALWPAAELYVCLDLDEQKLSGFRARHPRDAAVQGDAGAIPLASGCADAVFCSNMSHHLDDRVLSCMMAEAARVLKPDVGRLVFVDAVWAPRRLVGRLLWRYDRGSHPRTADHLRQTIAQHFRVARWERMAIFHEYVLCIAAPGDSRAGAIGPQAA
ncbi:MAG: class I SAM-dependent methyltransferase [Tepidisphaeraceae bacterium]